MKGQAILSTVIGTSAGVGMWILGKTGLVEGADEYALLFGLWTAFIEVIPYIGPWLSAVPPVIYALFVDPVGVIWVALLFLFIYQVEGHIVVPNVMASALRLHPLLVIFGLLAGGELYGIAGVLVALPTMAGLRAMWGFFRPRVRLQPWDEGRVRRSGRGAARTSPGGAAARGEPLGLGSDACGTRSPTRPRRRARSGLTRCSRSRTVASSRSSRRSPHRELGLGLETIYEGYLVHFGRPRLFGPARADTALLLGDYLYAHGLVRVAATGNVAAVLDLSELISHVHSGHERRAGTATEPHGQRPQLASGPESLEAARDALRLDADPTSLEEAARESAGDEPVERALAAHAVLVG